MGTIIVQFSCKSSICFKIIRRPFLHFNGKSRLFSLNFTILSTQSVVKFTKDSTFLHVVMYVITSIILKEEIRAFLKITKFVHR